MPLTYDGKDVIGVSAALKADVSEAVHTAGLTLHHGDRIMLTLHAIVMKVALDPFDKNVPEGALLAKFVLVGTDDVALGGDKELLVEARKAADARAGTPQLPMGDIDPGQPSAELGPTVNDVWAAAVADADLSDDDPMWDDDDTDGV